MYLWGRLIWDFTYKQLHTVFDKIEDYLNSNWARIGSRHTYNLHGFVYAFKICTLCLIRTFKKQIWIFETFPKSSIIGSPIPGVIPRAVAYPRMRCLHAPDCECIHDVTNIVMVFFVNILKQLSFADVAQTSLSLK
uniref:Uncharacterized protein n=1 Tax=Lactuca sativa TaxID=4236 RepID=A0A9R1VVM2_LACSA|nr:hypothetical protein LSAT_V11C400167680 [Lactuca sativa]